MSFSERGNHYSTNRLYMSTAFLLKQKNTIKLRLLLNSKNLEKLLFISDPLLLDEKNVQPPNAEE